MIRRTSSIVTMAVLLLLTLLAPALAETAAEPVAEPLEVIVKLSATPGSLVDLAKEMEAVAVEPVLPGRNIYLVKSSHTVIYKDDGTAKLDGDGKKWLKDAVRKYPTTVWAEARFQQTVDDDRFHAWPESSPAAAEETDMAGQPAFDDLALQEAHALSRGLGSVIAVLDTGVDPTHPLLASRLLDGYDLVDDDWAPVDEGDGLDGDGDGLIDEAYGHGTFIAGIVAQLAPEAAIVPIRVLDADGRAELYAVIEAIDMAIEMEVDVINMSFGILGRGRSNALDKALKRAHKAGIVVVAAAGNTGESGEYYPAAAKDVIAVTALGEDGTLLAPFSNHGKWVHVAAPGVDIVSAVPGGGYAKWSGTSMATPVVSSLGGLLFDHAPDENGKAVSKAILDGARKMDSKERADKGIIDVLGSFEKIR